MSHHPTIDCPHCGRRYALTDEYLAQYGGRETVCEACQGAILLPLPNPAAAVPPGQGASVLSYRAPTLDTRIAPEIWRDGEFVVVRRGVRLPKRCAICGAPVATRMDTVELRQGGSAIPLVITALFLGLFAALLHTWLRGGAAHTVTVRYGFCDDHTPLILPRTARLVQFILSLLLLPLFIGTAIAFGVDPMFGISMLCALGACFVGAIALAFFRPPMRLAEIEPPHAWLEGFGEGYLAQFPSLDDAQQASVEQSASDLEHLQE